MTFTKKITEELERANDTYSPLFQSRHEAYAVTKEEIEELKHEVSIINNNINITYWKHCINEKHVDRTTVINMLEETRSTVHKAMSELIQVGAMIEKSLCYERKLQKDDKYK